MDAAFTLRKDDLVSPSRYYLDKPNPMPESMRDKFLQSHMSISFYSVRVKTISSMLRCYDDTTVDGKSMKRRKSVWK